MANESLTVASAVVVPDTEESIQPASPHGKRRQSDTLEEEESNKRPRLSVDEGTSPTTDAAMETSAPVDRRVDRRKSGQVEERKRGQRLFGALLGTLSQSSSTVAQRRRVDIERKQQAKLKLQAEELDQKQKQRLEDLVKVRRKEQKKFDEQTMRIRHSNMLTTSHFLTTTTEPKLYYKPWELRPEEEAKIQAQVEEAQATVDRELEEHGLSRDGEEGLRAGSADAEMSANQETASAAKSPETVGPGNEPPDETRISPSLPVHDNALLPTNHDTAPAPDKAHEHEHEHEQSKDGADENGEVMLEGEEDTVIY